MASFFWVSLLDLFFILVVPILVGLLILIGLYHAKKHDNITTLSEGYTTIIGHSYHYYNKVFINNNEHEWIHNVLNKTKSKLLCLSFPFNSNYVLINDIKVIEFLFTKKEKDLFISRHQFDCYRDVLGLSLLNSNGDQHVVHKTKCINFLTQNMHYFSVILAKHSQLMISKMNDAEYHNINELLLRSCLASFCLIYIGTDLNLIQSYPNAHPFLNAYNQCLYYCNIRYYKSYWKLFKYLNVATERVINDAILLMDTILSTICESKKTKLAKIKMLNEKLKVANKENKLRKHSQKTQRQYIKMKHGSNTQHNDDEDEDPLKGLQPIPMDSTQRNLIDFYLMNDDNVDLQQLRDHIFNFLYSSRDHLALLISWFFYEITLKQNKLVYDKLLKEILSLKKYDKNKVKYLENCLFETLRLHPVKPWIIRQAMTNIKVPSTGNQIKRNDCIAIHNYSMGRSSKIWNKPNVFKPERFNDLKKKNNAFQCMFFGVNSRVCIGKQMAIDAAKIYVFNVLKDYDIAAKPKQNITYAASTVLHFKHGFYLKLIKR